MTPITENELWEAWKELYRTKPKTKRRFSRGIDEISVEKFHQTAQQRIKDIHRQISGGFFRFSQLKEYEIPRKGKTPRLIQAPTVTDRIVQKVLAERLMTQFHITFRRYGIVGSVRGTTVEKTVKLALQYHKAGYTYVLKTDIKNYFPNINQGRMKDKFYKYISDKDLRCFFTDYMLQSKRPGVPQGTPLSPFMSNLYLLDFDKSLAKIGDIKHIRYIDDVLIFCKDLKTAERAFRAVKKLFTDVDLEIHDYPSPGKTDIGIFNEGTIDILGVILKNNRLLLKPKKLRSIEAMIADVQFKSSLYGLRKKKRSVVNSHQAIMGLIVDLRHIIGGWSAAYSFCDVDAIYNKLNQSLEKQFTKLLDKLDIDPIHKLEYLHRLPKFKKTIQKK